MANKRITHFLINPFILNGLVWLVVFGIYENVCYIFKVCVVCVMCVHIMYDVYLIVCVLYEWCTCVWYVLCVTYVVHVYAVYCCIDGTYDMCILCVCVCVHIFVGVWKGCVL